MNKPLLSVRDLLEKVAEGNEMAFRTLFEHYSGNIYGSALTFTKSPIAAQEMVQEVFLKIWVKRETLLTVESFEDYIFIVARNIIFNYIRKQKRAATFKQHLQRYFEEIRDSPEDLLIRKQNEALLHEAIGQLPPQQRKIYTLRRIQGLSVENIANSLGLSKNTIRNHINAALHAIQTYLTDHSDMLIWVFLLPGLLVF
jgi:RNA polymerase sigma-70 factor (family 1)